METKFNSQICTTREQSERLLALGLKKETADMFWIKPFNEWIAIVGKGYTDEDNIPAWSLHRLILMIADTDLQITDSVGVNIFDPFGRIVNAISYSIKKGYFNKEYLNGITKD